MGGTKQRGNNDPGVINPVMLLHITLAPQLPGMINP